jgi:hypothetical protein
LRRTIASDEAITRRSVAQQQGTIAADLGLIDLSRMALRAFINRRDKLAEAVMAAIDVVPKTARPGAMRHSHSG